MDIMLTLLVTVVGAFLGSAATEWLLAFSRSSAAWEAARDEDVEDICEAIDALRTSSEKYWSVDHQGTPDEAILAAQIVAYQHHVGLLYGNLFTGQPKRDCDVAFTKVTHLATGGDFGEPTRKAETSRLTAIHQTALNFRHIAKIERRKLKRKPFA